jgi:RimJ/RimL family protein N-acetyltransferase
MEHGPSSDRITVESLAPEQFATVAKWLSRPEINRWLTAEWRNKEANPTLIAVAVRNRRNRFFLVRFDGQPCGLAGLADIDLADRIAMVWYLLGDDRFGRHGITSEAVRKVTGIAFIEMGLASLHAWIMEDNLASRRVLEKCGFRECGSLRDAANSNGRQVARVYFDLVSPGPGLGMGAT